MIIIDTNKMEQDNMLKHIALLEASALKKAEQGRDSNYEQIQMAIWTRNYLKSLHSDLKVPPEFRIDLRDKPLRNW